MTKINIIVFIGQLLLLMIFITGGTEKERVVRTTPYGTTSTSSLVGNEILTKEGATMRNYAHVKTNDSVRDVVDHPAFKGFGNFILPLDRGDIRQKHAVDSCWVSFAIPRTC